MQSNNLRLISLLALVFILSLSRLLPHPANFGPMAAIALFLGAHINSRSMRFAWMLLLAVISDFMVNNLLYNFNDPAYFIESTTLGIYGAYMLMVALGIGATTAKIGNLAGRSILASGIFYVVSNFFVWMGSPFYSQDLGGLLACYTAAIPFIQNSLLGDLLFTCTLFYGFNWLQKRIPALALQRA